MLDSQKVKRSWKHPEGYKYLAPWSNAVLLRFLCRKLTDTLPKSEYRTKSQLNDAARSVVSNIEEGYKRSKTKEYLDFLGYSQGSLEEVKGDIKRLMQDGFLKSKPGSSLRDLGIDLKEFKGLLEESKGEVPLETLYFPLKSLGPADLTFEIFMELINKTDYLLRNLVASLQKKIKLAEDREKYRASKYLDW
jgi:four helix bundle protein